MNKPGNKNKKISWTTQEIRFVEKHHGTLSVADIAEHLGRTRAAVKTMVHRLGGGAEYRFWTQAEKDVLQAHYAAGAEITTVMAMLPGRTLASIRTMSDTLGISRRRWRPEEKHILKKYYVTEGINVAERLPGRTPSAIRYQTHVMGLLQPVKQKWSTEELELLEKNQHLELAELASLFTARSAQAVCHARMKLRKRQLASVEGETRKPDRKREKPTKETFPCG